jgi:hypothetical protein
MVDFRKTPVPNNTPLYDGKNISRPWVRFFDNIIGDFQTASDALDSKIDSISQLLGADAKTNNLIKVGEEEDGSKTIAVTSIPEDFPASTWKQAVGVPVIDMDQLALDIASYSNWTIHTRYSCTNEFIKSISITEDFFGDLIVERVLDTPRTDFMDVANPDAPLWVMDKVVDLYGITNQIIQSLKEAGIMA